MAKRARGANATVHASEGGWTLCSLASHVLLRHLRLEHVFFCFASLGLAGHVHLVLVLAAGDYVDYCSCTRSRRIRGLLWGCPRGLALRRSARRCRRRPSFFFPSFPLRFGSFCLFFRILPFWLLDPSGSMSCPSRSGTTLPLLCFTGARFAGDYSWTRSKPCVLARET
ncbi:hypothetical protein BD289DRAFT_448980 [Coniella lustricola]|uniref:Uncharacterized protein n=1 Tax=Coniella lustricola TaxID=2025994 RepID=A0A2T2ZRM9_9PEZI|nr:hypothetical protein BD289DRAFT_448980 [Coniella lustricola]